MKKRNKPVLLVTILAVLVGIVFAMNNKTSGNGGDAPTPEAPPTTGQPRNDTPSAKDLAKQASSAPTQPTPPKEALANMPAEAKRQMMKSMGGSMGGDDSPSVEMPPAPTVSKPKPNDSSIAGQWYTDEARKPGSGK